LQKDRYLPVAFYFIFFCSYAQYLPVTFSVLAAIPGFSVFAVTPVLPVQQYLPFFLKDLLEVADVLQKASTLIPEEVLKVRALV
jgi:hypothetical protein